MTERPGGTTFQGAPLTLLGKALEPGQPAPDCALLTNDLKEVRLSDWAGKVRVVLAVPSLDTPVCDTETRRFNEAVAALGDRVAVLAVSMDLPFAQGRWCAAADIDRVVTLSDHRDASFAAGYGVLIKELRLLARAVFVLDGEGVVRYVQLVREVTDEPDYDAAMAAVRDLLD